MTTATSEPGLRERKRLATRRGIQRAVLTLVSDRGLDRVTVDDISAEAGVSPRTFFNYFGSKEAAVIGDSLPVPPQEQIDRFLSAPADGSVLDDLGELLAWSAEASEDDHELQRLRRGVLRDHPQIFGARMASLRQFESAIAEVVADRLARSPQYAGRSRAELLDRGLLVTLVAMAALKHAWAGWVEDSGTGSLAQRFRESFAAMHTIR
jgi:AcrR family transcriptional regulator